MSRASASLRLLLLISGCLFAAINAEQTGDTTVRPALSESQATVQAIQRHYNHVLHTSVGRYWELLQQSTDNNTVDRQYFENLDTVTCDKYYYAKAYFIFYVMHNDQFGENSKPDRIVTLIWPSEKSAIRKFFKKVNRLLGHYLERTKQSNPELLAKLTSWQNPTAPDTDEGAKRILESFIEFPEYLRKQVPELQLMDYTANLLNENTQECV
ncbi:uncharacterized protein LOC115629005 [Scaptodrosophila lebanonensis]|uniref:Uncharacterized protein LOC115629005 n=1 Tax=Drosophila lebanonensis TaxID=7225 RepID=A0A6J2U114_DROLE|nr:uncharacterized protein LOC115629005 [Scaptodrosophila lebanonensis]